MNFFTKQKESKTSKTNLWLLKWKCGGGGVNQEFGIKICTVLYIKQMINNDLYIRIAQGTPPNI